MRVKVRVLALPMLSDAIGGKETVVDLKGKTVADLIDHLVKRYGTKAGKALFDEKGKLDLTIQLLRNEKEWINRDKLDTRLDDGDTMIFMFLAGGG